MLCFGAVISPLTVVVLVSFSVVLAGGFYAGTLIPSRKTEESSSQAVVILLWLAATMYVLFSAWRIYQRWDYFSEGPLMARLHLASHRTGLTVTGVPVAVLLAAPPLFVSSILFADSVRPYIKWIAAALFAAFLVFTIAEGARLPAVTALLILVAALAIRHIRAGTLSIKAGALTIAALACVATIAAVVTFSGREALVGRNTASDSITHYRQYFTLTPDKVISHRPHRSIVIDGIPAKIGIASVLTCFYLCHPVKSVDRILKTDTANRPSGLIFLPNLFIAAQALGFVNSDWFAIGRFYKVDGLFTGAIGSLLIDFGIVGGTIVALLLSVGIGYAVKKAAGPHQTTITTLIAPLGLTVLVMSPLTNVINSALGQSALVWLTVCIGIVLIYTAWKSSYDQGPSIKLS